MPKCTELVRDYDPASDSGNAIIFCGDSATALWDALLRPLQLFASPAEWQNLRRSLMVTDYSWARTAERYEEIYYHALQVNR